MMTRILAGIAVSTTITTMLPITASAFSGRIGTRAERVDGAAVGVLLSRNDPSVGDNMSARDAGRYCNSPSIRPRERAAARDVFVRQQ